MKSLFLEKEKKKRKKKKKTHLLQQSNGGLDLLLGRLGALQGADPVAELCRGGLERRDLLCGERGDERGGLFGFFDSSGVSGSGGSSRSGRSSRSSGNSSSPVLALAPLPLFAHLLQQRRHLKHLPGALAVARRY